MTDTHDPAQPDKLNIEVVGRVSDAAIEAWAELLISVDFPEPVAERFFTVADEARRRSNVQRLTKGEK